MNRLYYFVFIMIGALVLGCSPKTEISTPSPQVKNSASWCESQREEVDGGYTLWHINEVQMNECKIIIKKAKQQAYADSAVVQVATLNTGKKQMDAISKVMGDNALSVYEYDTQAIKSGRVKSVFAHDHWNFASYYEIQEMKKQILAGIKSRTKVPVDCDDTMIHLYIALLKLGYPADQLYWNFYLVPPSTMTGVIQKMGGHAVLTAEVEGHVPMSLEDLSKPREQRDVEQNLGYYCVAWLRMDKDIRSAWHTVDIEGYKNLESEEISIDVAKSSNDYVNHTLYTSEKFHRGDR